MLKFSDYLIETSQAEKAIKAFRGQLKNVKTMSIMSPENPMGKQLSSAENKALREKFEKELKSGNFAFKKVKGIYNQIEHSYLIFNVKLNDVLNWCATENYNQESFFFCKTKYDEDSRKTGMIFTYYSKPAHGKHSPIETTDIWNNANDYEDYFTQIMRKFNFSIPMKVFEENTNEYESYLCEIEKGWDNSFSKTFEESINDIIDESLATGQNQYYLRRKINGKFF